EALAILGWEELPGLSEMKDQYRQEFIELFVNFANDYLRERGPEFIKNNQHEIKNQWDVALVFM
ncbi:MAG: hypothetical protein LBF41_07495, partial [Deltaproteobacteria bacterium]|nr:hypothetical protein [Deltaproteobacteria bacterium]